MNTYIRIMRLDHWVKQLFVLPGIVLALFLTETLAFSFDLLREFIIGFIATSIVASANYVINEWLDAPFDSFHPTKKMRALVTDNTRGSVIWLLWLVLTIAGFWLGYLINIPFFLCLVWLWGMGLLYNVKPFRTKDIPFVDVLSESVNNAIRLLLGWFIVSSTVLPPCSIILGYWMAGAYLMAVKRFAEYRMIDNKNIAKSYRASFGYYNEVRLSVSALFYAMLSVFFIGIFLVKYRIELLLFMPFLMGLYCYYMLLSYKDDSCVQKPEKLYREPKLIIYCIFLAVWFVFLLFCDFPWLDIFTTDKLVSL